MKYIISSTLILFFGNLVFAQSVVSYLPTGNIAYCEQEASIVASYISYLEQIKMITKLLDSTPKDSSKYAQYEKLLLITNQSAESIRSLVAKYENSLVASAVVKIETPKSIASKLLRGQIGEGKILISPSETTGDFVSISNPEIKLQFFGLRFCASLSANGGSGTKAVESILNDLFH